MIRYGSKVVVLLAGLMALTSAAGLAAGLGLPVAPALGSDSATVSAPPVQVTDIKWTLDSNPAVLLNVKVTIGHTGTPSNPEQFDIYLTLKDALGNTLGSPAPVRTVVAVDGGTQLAQFSYFGDNVQVSQIDSIGVTACRLPAGGQPLNTCQ